MRGYYTVTQEHAYDFPAHLCAIFVALAVQIQKKSYELLKMHLMPEIYQMYPGKMAIFNLPSGIQSVICIKGTRAI